MPSDFPERLPPELWALIGTSLPTRDLLNLRSVSTGIRASQVDNLHNSLLERFREERAGLLGKDLDEKCVQVVRSEFGSNQRGEILEWLTKRLTAMLNLLEKAVQNPLYFPNTDASASDQGVPVEAGAEWMEFLRWFKVAAGLLFEGQRNPDLDLKARCEKVWIMAVQRWGLGDRLKWTRASDDSL